MREAARALLGRELSGKVAPRDLQTELCKTFRHSDKMVIVHFAEEMSREIASLLGSHSAAVPDRRGLTDHKAALAASMEYLDASDRMAAINVKGVYYTIARDVISGRKGSALDAALLAIPPGAGPMRAMPEETG